MSPLVIDIGCVVVVLVSLLIGYYRGFIRSFLSVISWLVAAWGTWKYAHLVSPYLAGINLDPALQVIAANLIVFFSLLLLAAILSTLVARLIVIDTIAGVDRTLGAAFGIARGAVIVLAMAIISSYVFVADAPWWQDSLALALLEPYVQIVREMVTPYLTSDLLSS